MNLVYRLPYEQRRTGVWYGSPKTLRRAFLATDATGRLITCPWRGDPDQTLMTHKAIPVEGMKGLKFGPPPQT